MSSQRPNTPQRERPTEFRLSLSSNPSSRRSSLGNTGVNTREHGHNNQTMVEKYVLPQLQELADSMVTLDGNMTRMNFIHESITDLNESLSALLYGLMCNSWCVDFPRISHDTPHELSLMQRLEDLRSERETLLTSSSQTTTRHTPTNATAVASRIPVSHVSTPALAHDSFISANVPDNASDDAEDNTAASFVSNPGSKVPNPSKLRRLSILHQIRGSSSSKVQGASVRPDAVSSAASNRKRSLAVSAKRIAPSHVPNPQPQPQSQPQTARTKPRTKVPANQSRNLASRPPFR